MNLHGELRREVIREGELESILGKHGHARGKRTAATTRTRRATIAKRPPLAARILAAVLGRLLGFLLRGPRFRRAAITIRPAKQNR